MATLSTRTTGTAGSGRRDNGELEQFVGLQRPSEYHIREGAGAGHLGSGLAGIDHSVHVIACIPLPIPFVVLV